MIDELCANDQQTICRTLHLPLPTPDVPLTTIITQAKMCEADVLARLEQSRDLRAHITAHAMRGRIVRCPADPQLHPKPWPKPSAKSAVETPTRARAATATRTLVSYIPNPKKAGSAARARYALYENGLTETELLARGLQRADLRWDTEHKHLTWRLG
jgi:hypothetical protein